MDTLNWLNIVVTYVFIWAGTPAQGLFAGLWLFTRKWRGDALMTWHVAGRVAFFILLTQSFIVLTLYGLRPLDWPVWLILFRVFGDLFMLVTIYGQLFSLIQEMVVLWRREKK